MTDRFTDELWQGSADMYDAILTHPFLAGLTDGSLPQDAFVFYVVQDALYLHGYAQALAAVGSRAPDAAGIEMFSRDAADIVAVERTLHDSLLGDLGIDPASIEKAEPAPTTLAYVSYLLAAVRGGAYGAGTPRDGWDHSTGYLRRILADVWGAGLTVVEREFTLVGVNPTLDQFTELAAQLKDAAHTAAREAGRALTAAVAA